MSLEPATPQATSQVRSSIDSFSLSISPHASPSPLPHMKPPCRPFRVDPSRRMMSYLSAANREDTSLFGRSGGSVRRWLYGCDHSARRGFEPVVLMSKQQSLPSRTFLKQATVGLCDPGLVPPRLGMEAYATAAVLPTTHDDG